MAGDTPKCHQWRHRRERLLGKPSSSDVVDNDTNPVLSSRHRKVHNPLSIIGLFVGLVEGGLAYSFGVSSGFLQISVLVFMAIFAVGIAATFFVFLWKRPWVFYPPSEYSDTSVQAFVNAMRDDGPPITRIVVDSLSRAFDDEALLEKLDLGRIPKEQRRSSIEEVVQEIRQRVIGNVEASVVGIDARPLKGVDGLQWEEPYDAGMPVSRFLGRVWFRLQPFHPYPYGTVWCLRNATSGEVYDDIGPTWVKGQGTGVSDNRSLLEVGITGGITLEVFAIQGKT